MSPFLRGNDGRRSRQSRTKPNQRRRFALLEWTSELPAGFKLTWTSSRFDANFVAVTLRPGIYDPVGGG